MITDASPDGGMRARAHLGGRVERPPIEPVTGPPTGDKPGHLWYAPPSPQLDPWCSGPTCQPVTLEIAGSNPVGSAISHLPNAPSARPDGAFSVPALCP